MGDWPSAGARLGDGRGEAGHRGEALARARPAIRKRRRPGALVNRRRATPRFARTEATRLYMTANARSRLHPSYPCGYLGNSICRVSAGHSTPKRGVGCPPARARSGTGRGMRERIQKGEDSRGLDSDCSTAQLLMTATTSYDFKWIQPHIHICFEEAAIVVLLQKPFSIYDIALPYLGPMGYVSS
uniref:Uncharacterized protein n=1 Tax=Oryza sativa subsp. japonica TaxID=39947 RepID=Q10GC3_ORYSJ|nr:hypothetical protein LOC_Os03g43490 [Oryza sativa Japonica Group]